jgi:hypothetical protein
MLEDRLPWINVSDLLYWNSPMVPLFGIESIPHNLLINPDGIIVAKNLHGNDLTNELYKIYKY